MRGSVGRTHTLLGHLALCGERIKVELFLRGNFLMEQGKAFPVSSFFQVLWKLGVSFPRAEVYWGWEAGLEKLHKEASYKWFSVMWR